MTTSPIDGSGHPSVTLVPHGRSPTRTRRDTLMGGRPVHDVTARAWPRSRAAGPLDVGPILTAACFGKMTPRCSSHSRADGPTVSYGIDPTDWIRASPRRSLPEVDHRPCGCAESTRASEQGRRNGWSTGMVVNHGGSPALADLCLGVWPTRPVRSIVSVEGHRTARRGSE